MNQSTMIKKISLLFLIGFPGVLTMLPMIPDLLSLQSEPIPIPIWTIQLISLVQSSILLLGMVFLGSYFAQKVKLTSPIIQANSSSEKVIPTTIPQIIPGLTGGLLGGLLLYVFYNFYSETIAVEFLQAVGNFTPAW